jgi:RNA polymerase-associated protein
MPVNPQSRAGLQLAAVRIIEKDCSPKDDAMGVGGRAANAARKRLREQLLSTRSLFKASRFVLNPEMSLADCLVALVIWRLPWLGVDLGPEGKPIVDCGERMFHSQGFARSITEQEKAMRPIHEQA